MNNGLNKQGLCKESDHCEIEIATLLQENICMGDE